MYVPSSTSCRVLPSLSSILSICPKASTGAPLLVAATCGEKKGGLGCVSAAGLGPAQVPLDAEPPLPSTFGHRAHCSSLSTLKRSSRLLLPSLHCTGSGPPGDSDKTHGRDTGRDVANGRQDREGQAGPIVQIRGVGGAKHNLTEQQARARASAATPRPSHLPSLNPIHPSHSSTPAPAPARPGPPRPQRPRYDGQKKSPAAKKRHGRLGLADAASACPRSRFCHDERLPSTQERHLIVRLQPKAMWAVSLRLTPLFRIGEPYPAPYYTDTTHAYYQTGGSGSPGGLSETRQTNSCGDSGSCLCLHPVWPKVEALRCYFLPAERCEPSTRIFSVSTAAMPPARQKTPAWLLCSPTR